MSIHRGVAGASWPRLGKQIRATVALLALLFATWPQNLAAYSGAQEQTPAPPPAQDAPVQGSVPQPPYTPQTPEQLQQLVAPIALYPDSLVAQILAASTYPEQVVEADRFLQAHPELKDDALAQAVNQEPWDPSVKALTAFPSVLGNMDKNLSWTSSLGDDYYNQQQDVMNAIQVMRQKAQQAGNLKSTQQQTVSADGSNIIVEPADPQVVYVPAYDPWAIYGYPIAPWPYWYPYPGIWFDGPFLSFGVGFGIGFFGGFGWGWGHWGFDWHNHAVLYNHANYYSRSTTFYNRNAYYRGGSGERSGETRGAVDGRSGGFDHPDAAAHPFGGDDRAARGFAEPHDQTGMHSGAFSGIDRGGETRSFSSRGSASFGGGGFHGGGFGGGGFHGGGGRR